MNFPDIFLLSGPVHSGKTSRLLNWVENKYRVCGILAPLINGKRHLVRIDTKETRRLELVNSEVGKQPEWRIGNYVFSKEVFLWGQQILRENSKMDMEWLIIDEIGFLELEGKGFEPVVTNILKTQKPLVPEKILIIVRDNLQQKVLEHYQLDNIHKFDFLNN